MKKTLFSFFLMALTLTASAASTQVKEKLNRAPVAVRTSQGILVSWRYLSADGNATYDVYRGSTKIATVSDKTNYLDASGKSGDTYKVVSSTGDEATAKAWSSMYTKLSIPRPSARKDKNGSTTGRYRPDDISVGDVDGDGDYELIVKWLPDNQRDSGKDGYASATYIDCYEVDFSASTATKKWRVDMGDGIRSGNHTVQFVVYDLDGDGKAEMLCKTTVDSKDGAGNYVTKAGDATIQALDNTAVTVNSKGRVTKGAELLTVFNGETGAAMKTIWYSPNRNLEDFPTAENMTESSKWGDAIYNRCERYNAAVAYLDGLDKLPTAIMQRGYYTVCYIWAVDWDGTNLTTRWLHRGTGANAWSVVNASDKKLYDQTTDPVYYQKNSSLGLASSYGQGVHGISIGDVNNDGKDEICIGSATIGSDGKLMCATGYGHGDAIHLADLVPSRAGLEVMMPHEESNSFGASYGYDVHDATTGEVLASGVGAADNGRGIAGNFIPASTNSVCWSSQFSGNYDCGTGTQYSAKKTDTNFRIYWTGDPYDQTFDGRYDATTGCAPRICNLNCKGTSAPVFQEFTDYGNPQTVNTTKANPCLQADILGDWREEIIMTGYETDWSASTCDLLIFSTPEPTNYKVPCLMEDHVYRMGIVWQNCSYNQPPHLGYNLANKLGVTGSSYTVQTQNHAPSQEVDPSAPKTEVLGAPAGDKGTKVGTCYTAGANGELTASTSGTNIKMRTNNNGETITFSVNSGYVITGIKVSGYSNNTSTIADRSITLTSIKVDDATEVLPASVKLPGGTAGQDPVTAETSDFEAKSKIVLSFDNSLITTSDVDANGKNKQICATVTFTYKVSTGINTVNANVNVNANCYKVLSNGKMIIVDKNGRQFNTIGQQIR